jgi:hydrogenase maturation protease
MTTPRVLIACLGNIFLGDDGFGSEVARRLAGRQFPPEVILKDFGIRGIDLAYALLEPYELVILVDACPRGGEPGSVYLIEPALTDADAPSQLEGHSMNPAAVLRTVRALGGSPAKILLVGCEPADLGGEDGKLGLSPQAEAAVDQAIAMIERVLSGEKVASCA